MKNIGFAYDCRSGPFTKTMTNIPHMFCDRFLFTKKPHAYTRFQKLEQAVCFACVFGNWRNSFPRVRKRFREGMDALVLIEKFQHRFRYNTINTNIWKRSKNRRKLRVHFAEFQWLMSSFQTCQGPSVSSKWNWVRYKLAWLMGSSFKVFWPV